MTSIVPGHALTSELNINYDQTRWAEILHSTRLTTLTLKTYNFSIPVT